MHRQSARDDVAGNMSDIDSKIHNARVIHQKVLQECFNFEMSFLSELGGYVMARIDLKVQEELGLRSEFTRSIYREEQKRLAKYRDKIFSLYSVQMMILLKAVKCYRYEKVFELLERID